MNQHNVCLRIAGKSMLMFLFLAAMAGFTAPEPNSLRAVLAVETLSASVLTSEAMTLQFRAKSGLTYELALVRNATSGFWAISGTALNGMPGVIFGNTRLRFATSAALTSMGVAPTEAIREASPAIVGQIYDDVRHYPNSDRELRYLPLEQGSDHTRLVHRGIYREDARSHARSRRHVCGIFEVVLCPRDNWRFWI